MTTDTDNIKGSVETLRPEGIWLITYVFPEKNNHRMGRCVVFPYTLEKGTPALLMYANLGTEEKGGQLLKMSLITAIQQNDDEIQLSTLNSQYNLKRLF